MDNLVLKCRMRSVMANKKWRSNQDLIFVPLSSKQGFGSRFIEFGFRSRQLLNPNPIRTNFFFFHWTTEFFKIKSLHLYLPKHQQKRTFRLQENPPALRRALQTWNFFILFLLWGRQFWTSWIRIRIHGSLLYPDPIRIPAVSGSNPDQDMKH